MNKLTSLQSYNVLSHFLETYYDKTASDSLGALLSCMQFLDDGKTADTALWEDWEHILAEKQNLTSLEAFKAMRIFLNKYFIRTSSKNVKKLLKDIDNVIDNTMTPEKVWNSWTQCVTAAFKKNR
jgi:hypothetical protein